jgi:hypothetical protein
MINADFLNLIGLGEFGVMAPAVKTYRVAGSTKTHLKADRHPNAFKMIPIENGQRGSAYWVPRHLVSK